MWKNMFFSFTRDPGRKDPALFLFRFPVFSTSTGQVFDDLMKSPKTGHSFDFVSVAVL
jgi:hypothetical protein